jgi:hypothetical protein
VIFTSLRELRARRASKGPSLSLACAAGAVAY